MNFVLWFFLSGKLHCLVDLRSMVKGMSYEDFWTCVRRRDYAGARSLVEHVKDLPEEVMCQYCYMLLLGYGGSANPGLVSDMLSSEVEANSSELMRMYLGRSYFDQGHMQEALNVFYMSPEQPSPQLLYWRGITELQIDANSIVGFENLANAAGQGYEFATRDLVLLKLSRSHGFFERLWLRASLFFVKFCGMVKIITAGLRRS